MEALAQRYGREIFARLEADRPLLFTSRWWADRFMEIGMTDEAMKVQLFRFIDALPMLPSSPQMIRHLREYFQQIQDRLPAPVRWAVNRLPDNGLMGRAVAGLARLNSTRMARRFIAGTNVPETLRVIAQLRQQSLAFTIDLLGEAVLTEAEADHYQRQYLDLIRGLTEEVNRWPVVPQIDSEDVRGPWSVVSGGSCERQTTNYGQLPRVNVSIKLSSLFSQFDPINPKGTSERVQERLRPILRLARARGAFVNVDMEQFAYKDMTSQIFEEVFADAEFRDWPDVGIAIQAYLRSCRDDLTRLARWTERRGTPIWVRLVKGAYWDYETIKSAQEGWPSPVFGHKEETDANFEAQTLFLMERHHLLRPAIGSHNIRSIAYALAVADRLQLPPRRIEFQMLYGMADPIKTALVGMGERVRVYTPYGQLLPGMAYLVRRLLENTANQSFLRASFTERVSEEELLMNPEKLSVVHGPSSVAIATNHELRTTNHFQNEPLADFSQASAREAMQEALRTVKAQMGGYFPLVINGEAIRTETVIESVNPSQRREVVGRSACASVKHAQAAVESAKAAFADWRDTPVQERAEFFFRAADIVRRRRYELSAWEVYECGKQWREADADVAETIDFLEFYAHEMIRMSAPRRRDVPGEENEFFYEPHGVAVVIAPWNFPMAILCGMTTAALVSGNPAIMKPAEQSPIIAAKLMEVFQEAGLPKGVVHLLPGKGEEIGPYLVAHADVNVIAFTGSRPVGLAIHRQAAETPHHQDHVKRVICEMGGKNAVIVDDDADLDEAVHGVVASAFGYQGQKCSACSRVIVLQPIYEQFLNRLIEATRSLKVGPAEDPGCFVGPVIDDEARRRIMSFIEIAKQETKLAYSADVGLLADEGYYIGPHIFADVSPSAAVAQEEIFGPVVAVIRAADLTDALKIANGTAYALTGGLFSRSPANIARVRREFRVGNLYINRKITGALVDRQPFGGFKLSGIGSKAGGPDYLLQFLLPRAITENTMRHGFAPQGDSNDSPGRGVR